MRSFQKKWCIGGFFYKNLAGSCEVAQRAVKSSAIDGARCLLPVSNGERNFKMTYLRAPEELDAKIADLSFSARVVFLCKFLSSETFYFSRNLILKISACELNKQTNLKSWDR